MAAMDVLVGNDVVGMALNIKKRPQAQKVLNSALDGTVYVQNTGRAILRYEVNIYCGTKADRDKMDDASNNGDIVTVVDRDEVDIIGYIEDDTITWNEWIDGHGVGRFVLIKR